MTVAPQAIDESTLVFEATLTVRQVTFGPLQMLMEPIAVHAICQHETGRICRRTSPAPLRNTQPRRCFRISLILGFGAGNEARTRDLYLGKVPLYQLSYSRILGEGRIVCAGPAKSRQGAARGGENPWRTKGLRGQRLSSGHAARRYATMEMRVAAAASSVRTTPSG